MARTPVVQQMVVAGAVLLVLAGCSSGGDPAAGAAGAPTVSPLETYYGNATTTNEEERDTEQRAIDERIVACMREAGFDHTPVDPSAIDTTAASEAAQPGLEEWSVEDAARDGYNITTFDAAVFEEYTDPNEDYVASMSESEAAAYYDALLGTRRDAGYGAELNPVEAGCQATASTEVRGVDPASTPQFASLDEELTRTYEVLDRDPRKLDLEAAWAECMADAGYPGYESTDDPPSDIRAQDSALFEEVDGAADPAAYEEGLQALREVELATAVADATCQRDLDYAAEDRALRFAAEQEFVEAHRAELEAMAAARGEDQ